MFEVNEPIVIGDLRELKQDQFVVPTASNVLFDIVKASIKTVEDKDDHTPKFKTLSLQLRISEGIPLNGELKYAGKVMFAEPWVWANPQLYTKDYFKRKQHLVDLKLVLAALGYDLANVTISDDFISGLIGRQIRANVIVKKVQVKDPSTGEYVDTDEECNELKGWKTA
jgi:hypothetical protein